MLQDNIKPQASKKDVKNTSQNNCKMHSTELTSVLFPGEYIHRLIIKLLQIS